MYQTKAESDVALKEKFEAGLTESARKVLEKRYLKKDKEGKIIETAGDMFRRVAENIASADKLYGATAQEIKKTSDDFFEMQYNLEFLSGMPLRNAGRELQQLSACYVLPLQDSMESIYTTLKNAAFLHKTGAGIGYDFTPLRPRNDAVKSTGGKSCGPVGFMKLFEFSCATVVNNAATRRAGNMGILRIDHPDIEEFLTVKEDNSQLNNFNISVSVTDKFMEAVKADTDFDLLNPRDGRPVRSIRARDLWYKIAQKAWRSAEPGLLFFDEVNRKNSTPHVGMISATNQCGEQPLLPYEACNLGSINLAKFVKTENGKPIVDWDKLKDITAKGVHFLDNVVDMNYYLLKEIEAMNKGNRKIGLGVMGFADMLIELGIPYNSQEAVDKADEVMGFVDKVGKEASCEIAKKRGNFPNFEGSRWQKEGWSHFRNSTVTTIAPTGTTSMFANCSSGIEPIFALAYIRKNILDQDNKDVFTEVHPIFEQMAKDRWFYSRELMEDVANRGGVQDMAAVPEDVKKVFITSHDVSADWHVKIQAAFQKYTDNAVSKTVNIPHEATVEDVEKIYMMAYDTKCKGITIYRDGSREKQVLNLKK
ncbi:adenosylcobalamin-dependent ribonucleoside-diphosphate reductase [Candidatus Uhrbacteria bacterium]|nr:adenosylcobalamin-dependent ribonucleoside-diphosphate reductase [Candidatus Uhrbacteria bacterium]